MYQSGQGALRNDAEAIKWYRKAAEQGDALAQFNLGIMYTKGEGVSQNATEAALWYHLAADHGLAGAQFNLGMMYVEGQGVSQDYVQAHMWLNLAASQLPALGKDQRNTTVDSRDRVASKMTPPLRSPRRRSWRSSGRPNTAAYGDYVHFSKACRSSSAKKPRSALSCQIKFRRSQAICRVHESSAALAFMASFLRIGAQNLLVAR
jgi:Sel1 repeat